jgi:glutathione S-transferase
MSYKLSYFDAKGRGEAIRLIFAQAGVKFADDRIKHENWANIKTSKNRIYIINM